MIHWQRKRPSMTKSLTIVSTVKEKAGIGHPKPKQLKRVLQLSNQTRKAEKKTARRDTREAGSDPGQSGPPDVLSSEAESSPVNKVKWRDFRPGTGSRGTETEEGQKPRNE